MSYHNIILNSLSTLAAQSAVKASGQVAPAGYHYMPDGSLMLDSEHVDYQEEKVITNFDLDLSSLSASSSVRYFTFIGSNGAEFILEIRNEDNYYYNFVTSSFQAEQARLEDSIVNGSYKGSITFPTVTDDDQYDILIYAKPGTKHADYTEVRFLDNSIDINSSIGSNSLMMHKVIYQYTTLTLTIDGYSVNNTVSGTLSNSTITVDSGASKTKTPFSFTLTAAATAAYRILRQPVANDVLSFLQPTVGSAPETLPGENIYPVVTGTDTVNMAGGRDASAVAVTMDAAVATKMAVGDRVTGNADLDAGTFTVASLDSTNVFSISSGVAIADGVELKFSNQMNYRWPLDNMRAILPGMIIVPDTNIATDTVISDYKDTITILAGTKQEKVITKNKEQALDTKNQKPTVVKGDVTVQPGSVIFNKQQVLALAGDSLKVGGYGKQQILNVFGYEVILSNLAMTLSAPSTTTTEATSAHATIAVADREGIINNVSRVGGIGIDPSVQNPLITSGGGTDGEGDWVMEAVQTLESGVTLTVENTGRVATITGDIEIIKAGNANATLRFDVNNLLSNSAPS